MADALIEGLRVLLEAVVMAGTVAIIVTLAIMGSAIVVCGALTALSSWVKANRKWIDSNRTPSD